MSVSPEPGARTSRGNASPSPSRCGSQSVTPPCNFLWEISLRTAVSLLVFRHNVLVKATRGSCCEGPGFSQRQTLMAP